MIRKAWQPGNRHAGLRKAEVGYLVSGLNCPSDTLYESRRYMDDCERVRGRRQRDEPRDETKLVLVTSPGGTTFQAPFCRRIEPPRIAVLELIAGLKGQHSLKCKSRTVRGVVFEEVGCEEKVASELQEIRLSLISYKQMRQNGFFDVQASSWLPS
ncbi:unnamed protein product [Soboliphyme baturini]|uniref:PI3K/PI4K domain-containing protein n=1 Tax=Soboliphyme baturini TaxID=241478 RepID=A0A183IBW6_9BILA|nr:unnamed protein product [Soboliphyme baturini]